MRIMSTGISQSPDSRYWRQLYKAALSEIDKSKLPERIAEAERAVVLRARELFHAAGDNGRRDRGSGRRDVRFAKQLPKSGSVLVCFPLGIKSAVNVGISFMDCEELDQLEWDFMQARAGSLDIDSLGWTDREFSCLEAILDHKREGHQGERCPED
jgi:hypothetical protein